MGVEREEKMMMKCAQRNWLGCGPVNERREDTTIAGDLQRSQLRQVAFDIQTLTPQPDGCVLKGVVAPVAPSTLDGSGMTLLGFLQPGREGIKLALIQHRHAVPPIVLSFPRSLSSGEGAC